MKAMTKEISRWDARMDVLFPFAYKHSFPLSPSSVTAKQSK